jgi:hypothetical protein
VLAKLFVFDDAQRLTEAMTVITSRERIGLFDSQGFKIPGKNQSLQFADIAKMFAQYVEWYSPKILFKYGNRAPSEIIEILTFNLCILNMERSVSQVYLFRPYCDLSFNKDIF